MLPGNYDAPVTVAIVPRDRDAKFFPVPRDRVPPVSGSARDVSLPAAWP